jgi:hypothetical protein
MRSRPFRTKGIRKEPKPGAKTIPLEPLELEINWETISTRMGSTVSIAKSRITCRKNATREFMKNNCA